MKANELMIGDWLYFKSVPRQVDAIDGKRIGILHIWENIKETEPLPLTPEILEKNGFKRDMFYGEWEYNLYPFPFSVVQRKNNSWYLGREEVGIAHNREIIDISYVHELQHALRLCGIEKELVIEAPK